MSFWDPFFAGIFIPDPVHYVTSDANFRSKILRFLLGLVGSIPKTKLMSDYETIRHIMRIRDKKGVIGIFPEGRRTWDGHTLDLLYATAKLIKLLKIPVVVPIFKGAYISLPRWTKRPRRGSIAISYTLLFTAKELSSLGLDEISGRLGKALEYDEYEWQRTAMITFKGRRKAEYLELTLYACPECGGIATLRSKKDVFSCTSCGYSVRYNEYGFFEKISGQLRFQTVREWNIWQIEHLGNRIAGDKSRTRETASNFQRFEHASSFRIQKQSAQAPLPRERWFYIRRPHRVRTAETRYPPFSCP